MPNRTSSRSGTIGTLGVAKGNYSRPVLSLAFRLQPVPHTGVARVAWEGETP